MSPLGFRLPVKPVITAAAAAVVIAFLVTGCETTPESGGGSGTAGSVAGSPHAAGKRIYLTRCTACHSPEPVGDYTRDEWRSMVDHMRKRAKLQPHEEEVLLVYLMANAFDA